MPCASRRARRGGAVGSLSQYGATLARWFGAGDGDLDGLFPTLPNFPTRDLGFLA